MTKKTVKDYTDFAVEKACELLAINSPSGSYVISTVNEDGTIVQNDPAWGAASAAFSHEALQLIADNGTAVMLVQGIGDPLSTPDKYAALYNELKSLNMSENKLIWHSYTAEQFNYLQDYTIGASLQSVYP